METIDQLLSCIRDVGYFNPGKIQLVISGGLSGHGWIPRIFNRPEICAVHIS